MAMAPGRTALFTSLTCGRCRLSLLKCFGVDMPPARSFQAVRSLAMTASRPRQSLARSDQFDSLRQLQELSHPSASSPLDVSLMTEQDRSDPQSDNSIPWYLQDQPRSPSTPKHLLDRQKIPALPLNPPPMLEHFLTYISQDLGMDHLSLLDLRSLEPPAALGNNLIMIIGTARSEKHLNTAANRCCRWLRTNFKLRPHADGLLGRNELKLKVKRKNKRTKLLASVGSKEKPDLDDGIRTGWVCVHVGNVEPATTGEDKLALPVDVPSIVVEDENQEGRELLEPSEEDIRENLDQGEGFVGFGEATDGLTIVLQMFTEDKRSEVDLETLWSDILGKFQRRANNLKNLEPTENIHGSSPG